MSYQLASDHHSSETLVNHDLNQEVNFIVPHCAQVHHSLSMYVPHVWHSHPRGFGGCRDIVASSDMSELTAFLELLSRIELGRVWVDGAFDGALNGGGEGRSVSQASQTRSVDSFTRVQMLQVQDRSDSCAGGDLGRVGSTVDGGGFVEVGMGGLWPKYLSFGFALGEVPGSDLIGIGAP